MRINTINGQYDCPPSESLLMEYPNDMFSGFLWDGNDRFLFIPSFYKGFSRILDAAVEEHVPYCQMDDINEEMMGLPPHVWVMKGLESVIVREAENLIQDK